jgi:hypothetical protein
MKRIVIIFGLISGFISTALMLSFIPFIDKIGFDNGLILGYSAIVLSFLLVFFGIRSYRENVGQGQISFWRAFSVGLLITVISCAFYAITWQISYYLFMPDFFDKYANYAVTKMQNEGKSAQEIAAMQEQLKSMTALYKNPILGVIIVFFVEPFPVGLLVTLISSLILRKKNKAVPAEQLATST